MLGDATYAWMEQAKSDISKKMHCNGLFYVYRLFIWSYKACFRISSWCKKSAISIIDQIQIDCINHTHIMSQILVRSWPDLPDRLLCPCATDRAFGISKLLDPYRSHCLSSWWSGDTAHTQTFGFYLGSIKGLYMETGHVT